MLIPETLSDPEVKEENHLTANTQIREDLNELLNAVSRLYEQVDLLEISTQREIKTWSQTNLQLIGIINRQGEAIEKFGETAQQLAQSWQKSSGSVEKLSKELQDWKEQQPVWLAKWTDQDQGIHREIAEFSQQLQTCQAMMQNLSPGQTITPEIDFTKMSIEKIHQYPIRKSIDSVVRFKINGLWGIILAGAVGAGGICLGVIAKQQQVWAAFGGEHRYDFGRLLLTNFPDNETRISNCIQKKQIDCSIQLKDKSGDALGVKKNTPQKTK